MKNAMRLVYEDVSATIKLILEEVSSRSQVALAKIKSKLDGLRKCLIKMGYSLFEMSNLLPR